MQAVKATHEDLSTSLPERYKQELKNMQSLQILPLGGLGEIGMNMMVYRFDDEIIIVDCGGLMPESSEFGIDLIIPDISYLRDHKEKVAAVFLTHGHEDHISAIPYLLNEFDIPVYASPLTTELIKAKAIDHPHIEKADLRSIAAGDCIELKHFSVSFLHVNHSISCSVSLAIETPEGLIVHTGDFRIDQTPVDGPVFDYDGFAKLGKKGVLALLSDSTNVERSGFTVSEREVTRSLDAIIHRAEGRVMVSVFASSIPRIQELMHLAKRNGRKVHVAGGRLELTTQIARDLGLLKVDDSLLIREKDLPDYSPEEILILMTGSQGEPRSVLARVAMDNHKGIQVMPGDYVIFSARVIPGRERAVNNIINHLALRGAKIFHERTHLVHTSGHGHSGELATMLNLTRPQFFIPIHGEYYHLLRHARLAKECGVDEKNVIIAHDGDLIQFHNAKGALVGIEESGRVLVDGKGVGDVSATEVRERRKIAETGVVLVIMILNQKTGEILFGPELISRAFTIEGASEQMFAEGEEAIREFYENFPIQVKTDLGEIKEEIRLMVRRFFKKRLGRKPVVMPIIMGM